MPQAFPSWCNALARAGLALCASGAVGATWTWGAFLRSSCVTSAFVGAEQPVPFRHEHHAGRLGLQCRLCHTGVEVSRRRVDGLVFVALLAITAGAARLDLPPSVGTELGLAITATKACLIALFFMRLRGASARLWLVVLTGASWLLLIAGVLDDYLTG